MIFLNTVESDFFLVFFFDLSRFSCSGPLSFWLPSTCVLLWKPDITERERLHRKDSCWGCRNITTRM